MGCVVSTQKDIKGDKRAVMFICGPGIDSSDFCRCGEVAETLCDFPVGDGKTCDLPMCEDCHHQVGEDWHFCSVHFSMWEHERKAKEVRLPGLRLVR